ncbi:hypothetical protein BKA93DRAFT_753262 [Sparassis latifolia]|uniref:Uncharacterized protein n=1 Tax=Sparassis crispa TaxID=139825 RepID=A0A401GB96_9APHY|nr:predicted protein [Sparassis crispa]GBE79429.1 predicted protein [Sparassis crispa]
MAQGLISDHRVVYGTLQSEQPSDRVLEVEGGNDDINAGFGGKRVAFVWLVPVYTADPSNAASAFDVVIQSSEDPNRNDLAAGAGGDFRYLLPITTGARQIASVALLRSKESVDSIPPGYDGKTTDINKGRGGDFLYLLWQWI